MSDSIVANCPDSGGTVRIFLPLCASPNVPNLAAKDPVFAYSAKYLVTWAGEMRCGLPKDECG
jgi:hypothetical protein